MKQIFASKYELYKFIPDLDQKFNEFELSSQKTSKSIAKNVKKILAENGFSVNYRIRNFIEFHYEKMDSDQERIMLDLINSYLSKNFETVPCYLIDSKNRIHPKTEFWNLTADRSIVDSFNEIKIYPHHYYHNVFMHQQNAMVVHENKYW